jgi:hypothetical protein
VPTLELSATTGRSLPDATGTYEGWFITESTGNGRFLPGKFVFMRISVNDGGAGTTVVTRITTTDSVRVVKLSPGATDSTGTGLRGTTFAKEKDFVFTYDNTAGTGRPISGSFIESDGTSNTTSEFYSAFYSSKGGRVPWVVSAWFSRICWPPASAASNGAR